MNENFKPGLVGRVIRDYHAFWAFYTHPLTVSVGEELTIRRGENQRGVGWVWCINRKGKGGLVPESYLERQGEVVTVRCDYASTDLTVHVGEALTLHKMESGWVWATNPAGQSGWVPASRIESS